MSRLEMIELVINSNLDEEVKMFEIRTICNGGRSEESIKRIVKEASRKAKKESK